MTKWVVVVVGLIAVHVGAWAVTPLQPVRDDEVLEVLPSITRSRPPSRTVQVAPDPVRAAQAARDAIALARQTGDTRYWGRAQAALAPWWSRPNAPIDLAVLQATVQQGRHEFNAAGEVLKATLARTPGHAQGWLNLAALHRLAGRYQDAMSACEGVAQAGNGFYAQVCALETRSLQGQHVEAGRGLTKLIAQTTDKAQQAWLLSLLAEAGERAGQDGTAAENYKRSLMLDADLYTSIAFSDLLLRTGQASEALKTLALLPETDAVLLRRAAALRLQGDGRWRDARAVLSQRHDELKRRGDDITLHGREQALAALWLDDDAPQALKLARSNLKVQREPVDWWVAIQSAKAANDRVALTAVMSEIRVSGLTDARLTEK